MGGNSGGGGRPGRGGGGGGPDMTTPVKSMSDDQIVSGVKTLDSESRKTMSLISQARDREDFTTTRQLRPLVDSLDRRKAELIREAATRSTRTASKGIWDKVKVYKD